MPEMDTTDVATPTTKRARRAAPVLVVVHSPDASVVGRELPVGPGLITLGRAPECTLAVADPRMSRNHARIQGGRIHDQKSANGTWVSRLRLSEAALAPGDVIRVGDTLLVIEPPPPPEPGDAIRELIGLSSGTKALRYDIQRLAHSDLTVLIQGPTGSGKEVAASAIHRASNRRRALVPLNCAAIPEGLAESTLFGHERGAFTGATDRAEGVFVRADGGTLFLDEVGELALMLQAKLLRVLEDRVVTPVGGRSPRKVDVRVIAASHVDLDAAARDGRFRHDLLARLKEWVVFIPPLSQRRADIPGLLQHFATPARPLRPTSDALELLLTWDWPDNVRGIRTVVRRWSAEHSEGGAFDVEHLPPAIRDAVPEPHEQGDGPITEAQLRGALGAAGGSVSAAAKLLGCTRQHVDRLRKKFGLVKPNGEPA
jgi:DNA-binding NtrC family response regulator